MDKKFSNNLKILMKKLNFHKENYMTYKLDTEDICYFINSLTNYYNINLYDNKKIIITKKYTFKTDIETIKFLKEEFKEILRKEKIEKLLKI